MCLLGYIDNWLFKKLTIFDGYNPCVAASLLQIQEGVPEVALVQFPI